jgi:hypothetical protein
MEQMFDCIRDVQGCGAVEHRIHIILYLGSEIPFQSLSPEVPRHMGSAFGSNLNPSDGCN